MSDDFYVGWQQYAPRRTARAVRAIVLLLAVLAVGIGVLTAIAQRLIGRSMFEWRKVTEFSGVLRAHPIPHLVGTRNRSNEFHYLVHPWKFGFDPDQASKLNGKHVTLRGTRIHRDNQAMIEVQRGSVMPSLAHSDEELPEPEYSAGELTFVGEIVDSKCYLGVMNPGQLKPHRACAVRCISGGVPPVLLVRENTGKAQYLLLVSRDGTPVNQDVLKMVAEPVRITGELVRKGEMMILRADPKTYQRIE